ncbi:thiol reductant ABC exporter subunit CydD [Mumia sp. zg.B53]|uniref:thiol reductant ABC exporter subunit CydD n=1 Tax=unclassified Mumia TaxID=2621872 RepID=UPI001C6E41CC|nr:MULTISPECIES: thiol reductant ABC exporter subunit CydD [unclassified Mumia]MBW9205594.1 thiol reductant ABC exporter subunit CydD [Mumia sp. zg.B17]MBW9216362.1 thiol reductant ABC exporter subunit CydD [Mumia sp. zg.B53]
MTTLNVRTASSPPLDPRLVRRSRAVRTYLAASVVIATAMAALVVGQSWLIARVVSEGFERSGLVDVVTAAVLALAAVILTRAVLGWLHAVVSARAAARVKVQLREEVVGRLLDGAPHHGARPESSHVVTLLGPGMDKLDTYFARYLPQLALALTVPAVVVVAVFVADPLSGITIAVTLPLIVVFMVLVGYMTRDRTERRWRAMVRLSHHFADVLDGLVVLKVFGRSRNQTEGIAEVGERNRKETMGALRLAFLSSFVLELVATISVALVAVSIGLRIVEGHLSLMTGLFVLVLAPEAYLPIRQVGAHFHDSAEGQAVADDVYAILDDQDVAVRRTVAPDLGGATIVVDDVSVSYPGRTTPALAPTSLVLEPGRVLAVTGSSGCGKSTLVDVLMGFVAPTTGRVTVRAADGTTYDLADIDLASWRSRMAWVPQVPGLLSGTVAGNVRLGARDASDDEVAEALRDAGAPDLSPQREVHEGGANLSAGERRRLAVARALLRVRRAGATVMLLDEPTAGLDTAAEEDVRRALRAADVTVLVVAHRRALVDDADRVVPLVPAGMAA